MKATTGMGMLHINIRIKYKIKREVSGHRKWTFKSLGKSRCLGCKLLIMAIII